MSKMLSKDSLDAEAPSEKPKVRMCLRCQTKFESKWNGERICSRCKGSNAWRSSVPLRSTSSGSR